LQYDNGEPLSDTDLRDAQQECLLAVVGRQVSCSLGRAAFSVRTLHPAITQHVCIPALCVRGRVRQAQECRLNSNEFALTNFNWPQFHNGVAAGLQIVDSPIGPKGTCIPFCGVQLWTIGVDSSAQTIDNTWIVYNMPAGQLAPSDAGLLFGLGLNGYLWRLNTFTIHEYLTKRDVFTGVAVLLGCAASKIGSGDHRVRVCRYLHFLCICFRS
jgi:anaphase-promoting complex subunit 1